MLIEGVRIRRSPMWEIHPVLCTNVIVRGVKIDTHGPNNDGCDPESCRDVLIEDCVFDTGDDCIAIKWAGWIVDAVLPFKEPTVEQSDLDGPGSSILAGIELQDLLGLPPTIKATP